MTSQQELTDRVRRLTVSESGRIVIPVKMREALGVRAGGPILARVEGGRLVLEPVASALARVRAWTAGLTTSGESLVDELLADRRRESSGE